MVRGPLHAFFIVAVGVMPACFAGARSRSADASGVASAATPHLAVARESAAGMLAREYNAMTGELGPLPGHVIGLVLPAQSKWGRSLEWIGEAVSSVPEAYVFSGDEKRAYELYAAGVAPRLLKREGAPLVVGRNARQHGLVAEAHLADVEFGNGFGTNLSGTYEAEATHVSVLDGKPGYPKSVASLLDAARAQFDGFAGSERDALTRVMAAEKKKFGRVPASPPSGETTTDTLFPVWDEGRKRLVVLFHRRVMRMVHGSVPCMMTYEGMPPEQSSTPLRYGYGVELGTQVEVDVDGRVAALRLFAPAGISIAPNVQLDDQDGPYRICPGSPGLSGRGRVYGVPPIPGEPPDVLDEEPRCGNAKRETTGAVPEECDGADLGAASCENLGFQGGKLRCSNDCKLAVDTCAAAPPPSRVQRRALPGDSAGLALASDGALLAVGSVHRGLEFFRFDRETLKTIGSKTTWTMPEGSGSTVSTPFVASLEDRSSLIAVTRYGQTLETLIFRVGADGRITETGVTVPGRALFLTPKGDRALLGTLSQRTGNTLETAVVDGQGKLLGTPKPALTASTTSGYVRGAAVATPSGWLASLGTNGTFFSTTPFARIATDGQLIGSGTVPVNGGQMAVARGPSSSFLVQTHPGGILVTEISDAGVPAPSRKLSSEPMSWMVAATVERRRVIAWASDYAKLRRFELKLDSQEPTAATVIAVPMYIPVASIVAHGKLHHVFQMSPMRNGAMERALWMFSGR